MCHATGQCHRIQHIGQKWKNYVDVNPMTLEVEEKEWKGKQ
jgi:hypothetical protein